jgi:hypothetical protein
MFKMSLRQKTHFVRGKPMNETFDEAYIVEILEVARKANIKTKEEFVKMTWRDRNAGRTREVAEAMRRYFGEPRGQS